MANNTQAEAVNCLKCFNNGNLELNNVFRGSQHSTLTVVWESETPKYCVGFPDFTAWQSVGLLNF